MKKLLRYCLTVVILAALIWGGIWGYRRWFGQKTKTVFKTEAVEKSDLASTISATGTVEPEELVNVGAQVSGKIAVFGRLGAFQTNGCSLCAERSSCAADKLNEGLFLIFDHDDLKTN